MRQSIGGAWIMGLMVFFIFLFAGYIILSLNYARVIKVKNEMVSIIEKYEGINSYSVDLLNSYLVSTGYSATGICTSTTGEGVYGGDIASGRLEKAAKGIKYSYCVKKYNGIGLTNYYQVTLFYKFNLPVIGNASGFSVKGTTNSFIAQDDREYCTATDGSCR